jgi:precorrin-2 methylase
MIGAGNPDYVSVQAINALNEVDVFFNHNEGRGGTRRNTDPPPSPPDRAYLPALR